MGVPGGSLISHSTLATAQRKEKVALLWSCCCRDGPWPCDGLSIACCGVPVDPMFLSF